MYFFLLSLQSKPVIADPIDFEGFILKNKTLIQNDPQRELLMYPIDDVSVSRQKIQVAKVNKNFVFSLINSTFNHFHMFFINKRLSYSIKKHIRTFYYFHFTHEFIHHKDYFSEL